jgi:hypothetical protein
MLRLAHRKVAGVTHDGVDQSSRLKQGRDFKSIEPRGHKPESSRMHRLHARDKIERVAKKTERKRERERVSKERMRPYGS